MQIFYSLLTLLAFFFYCVFFFIILLFIFYELFLLFLIRDYILSKLTFLKLLRTKRFYIFYMTVLKNIKFYAYRKLFYLYILVFFFSVIFIYLKF